LSKRIADEANLAVVEAGFKVNAISVQLFGAAVTYGYKSGDKEYTLRDLFCMTRIREIFPRVRENYLITDEKLEIWQAIVFHVKSRILQWDENSSEIKNLLDCNGLLKRSSEVKNPIYQLGGLCTNRIEVTGFVKEYLSIKSAHDMSEDGLDGSLRGKSLHDINVNRMMILALENPNGTEAKELMSILDNTYISILLNMRRAISDEFLLIAKRCGYDIDIKIDDNIEIINICREISQIRMSSNTFTDVDVHMPAKCVVMQSLNYAKRYTSASSELILYEWTTNYEMNAAVIFSDIIAAPCLLSLPLKNFELVHETVLNNYKENDETEVASANGFYVTAESMARLNTKSHQTRPEGNWLNGVIIDYFTRMVVVECGIEDLGIMDCDFMKTIIDGDENSSCYKSAIREALKKKEKKKIIAIVNLKQDHYSFIVINISSLEVSYFDGCTGKKGIGKMKKLLMFWCKHILLNTIEPATFTVPDVPGPGIIQKDSYNCGLLVCIAIDLITHGQPVQNVEIDRVLLNQYRIKLSYIILNSSEKHASNSEILSGVKNNSDEEGKCKVVASRKRNKAVRDSDDDEFEKVKPHAADPCSEKESITSPSKSKNVEDVAAEPSVVNNDPCSDDEIPISMLIDNRCVVKQADSDKKDKKEQKESITSPSKSKNMEDVTAELSVVNNEGVAGENKKRKAGVGLENEVNGNTNENVNEILKEQNETTTHSKMSDPNKNIEYTTRMCVDCKNSLPLNAFSKVERSKAYYNPPIITCLVCNDARKKLKKRDAIGKRKGDAKINSDNSNSKTTRLVAKDIDDSSSNSSSDSSGSYRDGKCKKNADKAVTANASKQSVEMERNEVDDK
jgi:hypothetical protein